MCIVERIIGTAEGYVLTGTVSRDGLGRYVAHVNTYSLKAGSSSRPLRSVAAARADVPAIETSGASAADARARLCEEAKARLGTSLTSFVWNPVLALAVVP
jgi:hypothetical protein